MDLQERLTMAADALRRIMWTHLAEAVEDAKQELAGVGVESHAKRFRFRIETRHEPAAGIVGSTDVVTVGVESGEPGGEPGEFERELAMWLSEWFDAAVSMERP